MYAEKVGGGTAVSELPRSRVHIHPHRIHVMHWNWDNCNVCGQQQCMIEPISVHTHAHKASHLRQVSHSLAYGQALIVDGTSTPGGQTIANIHTPAMRHACMWATTMYARTYRSSPSSLLSRSRHRGFLGNGLTDPNWTGGAKLGAGKKDGGIALDSGGAALEPDAVDPPICESLLPRLNVTERLPSRRTTSRSVSRMYSLISRYLLHSLGLPRSLSLSLPLPLALSLFLSFTHYIFSRPHFPSHSRSRTSNSHVHANRCTNDMQLNRAHRMLGGWVLVSGLYTHGREHTHVCIM